MTIKGAKVKMVKQGDMTADCFMIQLWGLSACETCEVKDTSECGGQEIRKDLLEKGQHGKIGEGGLYT